MSFRKLNQLHSKKFRDSMAYQQVGKICWLCKEKITNRDVEKPRRVFVRRGGEDVMHDVCFEKSQNLNPNFHSSDEDEGSLRGRIP